MSDPADVPDSAAGIRTLNGLLDAELVALANEVSDTELLVDPRNGEWSLGQLLAHIGEFPAFFARDLARWIDDPTVEVGRTHDHPGRNATVDGVADERPSVDGLVATMIEAFAAMETTFERLTDEHLNRSMNNVKYGVEAPDAYFRRYVIGHKLGHLEQLRSTITRVRGLAG